MDLVVATWGRRDQSWALVPADLYHTLQGINDAIVRADRRLADAPGMSGIGYADRGGAAVRVAEGLGVINAYLVDLPGDIAEMLDEPLFEALANGAAGAVSEIRADGITTPNTLRLVGRCVVHRGDGVPPAEVADQTAGAHHPANRSNHSPSRG